MQRRAPSSISDAGVGGGGDRACPRRSAGSDCADLDDVALWLQPLNAFLQATADRLIDITRILTKTSCLRNEPAEKQMYINLARELWMDVVESLRTYSVVLGHDGAAVGYPFVGRVEAEVWATDETSSIPFRVDAGMLSRRYDVVGNRVVCVVSHTSGVVGADAIKLGVIHVVSPSADGQDRHHDVSTVWLPIMKTDSDQSGDSDPALAAQPSNAPFLLLVPVKNVPVRNCNCYVVMIRGDFLLRTAVPPLANLSALDDCPPLLTRSLPVLRPGATERMAQWQMCSADDNVKRLEHVELLLRQLGDYAKYLANYEQQLRALLKAHAASKKQKGGNLSVLLLLAAARRAWTEKGWVATAAAVAASAAFALAVGARLWTRKLWARNSLRRLLLWLDWRASAWQRVKRGWSANIKSQDIARELRASRRWQP